MSPKDPDRDGDLRESFQAQRRMETAGAPPFDPAGRPARLRPAAPNRPARLVWSTAVFLILGALLVLSVRSRRPTESSIVKAIAQAKELRAWSASTDALLPEDLSSSAESHVTPDEPATQPSQSPD